jgi:ribosomal protein S18 acetylase RimI-like enzyme
MPDEPAITISDVGPEDRPGALPIIIDSFVGIYRWHAKRTLRDVSRVRGATSAGGLVGVTMLELLEPEVGYVYYIAVLPSHRGLGVGHRLLDDALELFRRQGARVVYAAAEEENTASIRLFVGRGFRRTERKELGWREGGLGAWGLRSRMMVVSGEELFGLRLSPEPGPAPTRT